MSECTAIIQGPTQEGPFSPFKTRVWGETRVFTINDEKDLAEAFFITWKNSPPHYSAVIDEEATELSIAVRSSEPDAEQAVYVGSYNLVSVFSVK